MVPHFNLTADRRRLHWWGWCLCLLAVQLCSGLRQAAAQEPAADLQILRSIWGWDGYVQEQTFSPFSVKVRNNGAAPWSGTFRLSMIDHAETPIGATTERLVTLQARSEQWVQLIPYVADDTSQWILSWGADAKNSKLLPEFHGTLNVDVLLTPDESPTPVSPSFPNMPAAIFPQSVAGMSGVSKILLDFVPDWNDAQQQVFLDWLQAGGRVIVSQTAEHTYPAFGGDLQILNHSAERLRIGAGLVTRVPRRISDADWYSKVTQAITDNARARTGIEKHGSPRRDPEYHLPIALGDTVIFQQLLERVRFNRNWLLVNASVVAYLMMLFPVCYVIGHRKKKVGRFYIVFLGSILAFSLLFWMIGQLGASEQNRIASVAVAQSVGRNRLTVTQWSQLAAVHELDAEISHDGIGLWYGTGPLQDRTRGVLQGAVEPHAKLRFPPASTRTLMQQETLISNKPAPTIEILDHDEVTLRDLKFSITGSFEHPPVTGWAVYNGLVYPLELKANFLQLKERAKGVPLGNFLVDSNWWKPKTFGLQTPQDQSSQQPDSNLEMVRMLLASSLGITETNRTYLEPETRDRIRLAVLTAMPEEFFARSPDFRQQSGQVLWIYDLPAGK